VGIYEEYRAARTRGGEPMRTLALDT